MNSCNIVIQSGNDFPSNGFECYDLLEYSNFGCLLLQCLNLFILIFIYRIVKISMNEKNAKVVILPQFLMKKRSQNEKDHSESEDLTNSDIVCFPTENEDEKDETQSEGEEQSEEEEQSESDLI